MQRPSVDGRFATAFMFMVADVAGAATLRFKR